MKFQNVRLYWKSAYASNNIFMASHHMTSIKIENNFSSWWVDWYYIIIWLHNETFIPKIKVLGKIYTDEKYILILG